MQIQLKMLAEEMQSISKGLEKVKQELSASETDGPVSEVFHKVFITLHLRYLSYFSGNLLIFTWHKFVSICPKMLFAMWRNNMKQVVCPQTSPKSCYLHDLHRF